ncbi:MAG: carboxymuconolactone decarboxylase family protein [Prevotella sp.]|nr:carboxymuconolactone decarboxylase family protein [Prevotella sp.]
MENILTLSQQHLVAIACLEAKGDQKALARLINDGLDHGLTVSEIKEALAQLYAYTGFPRSLNALATLQQVLGQREAGGRETEQGTDASPLSPGYNALRQGTEVQTRLTGKPFDYHFSPSTDYYLKAHLFGDIFARDNLTFAQRELVTVGALSGLEGVEPQLKAHIAGARNMGLTDEEIHCLPMTLAALVGETEAFRAAKAIAEVYGEPFGEGRPVDFTVWPKGSFNAAYAQFFTGNSYLASLDAEHGGPVNVTFEPRCRNNWHIHHKATQVLVCVSGRGWYVEEGKEPREMRPGTVVPIPAEAKHWHGAARDSWFQHLTYMTQAGQDSSTEWLEPVADSDYDLLP